MMHINIAGFGVWRWIHQAFSLFDDVWKAQLQNYENRKEADEQVTI
jgi:hypothetical protein